MPEHRIISGEETSEHVDRLAALHFARLVAASIHDRAPVICSRLRQAIRSTLNTPMLALTNREFPLGRLYPYPSDGEAVCIIYRDIRTMLHDRTLLAALTDDHLAGIGGYQEVSRLREKEPVVELRRTVMDPEYRGQGLYTKLADERLQLIEEHEPGGMIINATRQPSVIRWSEKNAFTEINWERFYMEHKQLSITKHQESAFDDRVKRFGWRYFERPAEKRAAV